jgi:IS30 family transposase
MIISKLNNRPRKLLGYKTPNEVFLANFNQSVALIV